MNKEKLWRLDGVRHSVGWILLLMLEVTCIWCIFILVWFVNLTLSGLLPIKRKESLNKFISRFYCSYVCKDQDLAFSISLLSWFSSLFVCISLDLKNIFASVMCASYRFPWRRPWTSLFLIIFTFSWYIVQLLPSGALRLIFTDTSLPSSLSPLKI